MKLILKYHIQNYYFLLFNHAVLFDSEFSGGLCLRSSSPRSYRLPGSALINITHGQRLNAFKNDTMKTLWSQMPTQGKKLLPRNCFRLNNVVLRFIS